MTACELCWNQAYVESRTLGGSQADIYHRLLVDNHGKPGHEPEPIEELRAEVLTQTHGAIGMDFEDKPDPFHTEDWARP